MKKLLSFVFLLGLFLSVSAQNIQITGTIVSGEDDYPLPGVNVIVKGTTNGTITDLDGQFTLSAPSGSILSISYIGYTPQEVKATGQPLQIVLKEDTETLDEVVVVGYGVQKKSVVTAAISRVTSEDLNMTSPTRVEDVLKGKVSGVQIIQESGQPGSDSSVRIRGIGTVNNNDPLYIVDGMPVNGGIRNINPADIESVEVLKDAASAAIYGTRGANGVILITTKSGSAGKATINYDVSYGWQNPWKKKALLDGREYMTIQNEMAINDGNVPRYTKEMIANARTTDWQDETFNYDAPVQSHQISLNGGNEKGQYYLSFGYFNQEGIVGGDYGKSNFERYNLRINSTYNVYEAKDRSFLNKVKVGTNIGYTRAVSSKIEANSEWGSILGSAIAFDPTLPVYASEQEAAEILEKHPYAVTGKNGRVLTLAPAGFQEIVNPVGMLNQPNSSKDNEDKIVAAFWGEIDIIKGLKFRSSYSADLAFWGNDSYEYPYFLSNQGKNSSYENSFVSSEMNRGYTWQVENYFTYDTSFKLHNIQLMAGQSAYKSTSKRLYGLGRMPQTFDPDKAHIDNTTGAETTQRAAGGIGIANFHSLASYFGRVNYNFAERYIISASLRYDGSSRFGSNNIWKLFPAVSVGWNILNEPYLESSKPNWFDALKLRFSWGKNGNEEIGDLSYAAYDKSGYNYYFGGGYSAAENSYGGTLSNGIAPGKLPNPSIRWEESEQIDVGLEARFFNNALSFGMDYFKKKTIGMLKNRPKPEYAGQDPPTANVGTMENWGLEFELGWKNKVSDFNYYVNLNATYIENKLITLGNASGFDDIDSNAASGVGVFTRGSNGNVYPYFYGLKTNGLFQNQAEVDAYTYTYVDSETNETVTKLLQPNAKPGDVRFIDLNNDGKIDDDDKTKIGKGMPDWTFGISLGADYKGFDISLFFQGSYGNDIFDFSQRSDVDIMNSPEWILQRWHGEGTSNKIPRVTSLDANRNWNSSDLYIKDGSYLRLKSAQFGYTLPFKVSSKVAIQKLRVFVSGENLLTFTGYDGFDPEISSGIDRGVYPQSRTISIGANITF